MLAYTPAGVTGSDDAAADTFHLAVGVVARAAAAMLCTSVTNTQDTLWVDVRVLCSDFLLNA